MATEIGNSSLGNESQNLTCLEEVRIWVWENSTTVKILGISGCIVFFAIPFIIPCTIRTAAICMGIGSGILAGLIIHVMVTVATYLSSPKALPNTNVFHLRP